MAYLIYLPTHIRGVPFLVGIVLGYFIYDFENSEKPKQEKSTVSKKVQIYKKKVIKLLFKNFF